MIPSKLRLAGFLSYQQPVELDFSSFGLACISGSNGAGKSSLLDAITWVIFGEARMPGEAVINDKADQAEVGLDFFYESEEYRIQRSKQRNKSVVLDFFIKNKDEGWKPLTEATVRKTEEKIRETLRMDYEVFTNASFFLQGKADEFAIQKAADRKRILSSILGLDQWDIYKEKAIAYRKALESEETRVRSSIAEWEREINEEDQRKTQLQRITHDLEEKNALLKNKDQRLRLLRDLKRSLEGLQEVVFQQKKQLDALMLEVNQTQTKIEERKQEIEGFHAVINRSEEIEKGYAEYRSVLEQIEKLDELSSKHNTLKNIANESRMIIEKSKTALQTELESLEKQSKKVLNITQDKGRVRSDLATINIQAGEMENAIEKKNSLKKDEAQLQEQYSIKTAENGRLEIEMQKLKSRIEQLHASGKACPLCGNPMNEEDKQKHVREIEDEGKILGDQFRANKAILISIQSDLAIIRKNIVEVENTEENCQALKRKISAFEQQLQSYESEISEWEEIGSKRREELILKLERQEFEIESFQKLNETENAIKKLAYDPTQHEELRRQKTSLAHFDTERRNLDSAKAQSEPVQRELQDLVQQKKNKQAQQDEIQKEYLEKNSDLEKRKRNLPDLKIEEEEFLAIQTERDILQRELGAAKQRVDILKQLKVKVGDYNEQLSKTRQEIMHTRQLENAFGANGIPALLVEEALPALEAHANEILDRLSSGNMSVRFDTQKELKSKDEKRETLDIFITDPAGTRPYEMFSGGEAFRVNFAIRLALSHLLAQRAGARLQTLVIDEGFGSQDGEGRQRLIEAINQVKNDFEKIIVITHLEEFKDAFPARIEVEKTLQGSTVKVVST